MSTFAPSNTALYHVLQALSGKWIAAVRDMEPAVGVAVLLEFPARCAPAHHARHESYPERTSSSPASPCLSDDPDAQHPRHSGNGRLHAAIAGQIGQRFQRKEQMGVLVVAEHLFTDLVKLLALSQPDPADARPAEKRCSGPVERLSSTNTRLPGFSCWYSSAASWAALAAGQGAVMVMACTLRLPRRRSQPSLTLGRK